MMKIATSLNIRPPYLTELTLMPRLKAAGFEGIDFNFCDLYERCDWFDEKGADAFGDTWGQAASDAGLRWVQSHGPMFSVFGDSAQDNARRAMCSEMLRVCGRVGVPWMVLHPGHLPGSYDAAHQIEILDRNLEFFRSLLPHCEKHNVGIAIENMLEPQTTPEPPRRFGAQPTDLIALIDALDHPLMGACWDTGHAKISRLDQRTSIASLGSRLKVVHIQENDSKGDDHMLPFVNGPSGIDWKSVMEGLREGGYQGAFTYEAHNSFRAVPEVLLDDTLHLSVKIARYLAAMLSPDA